MHVEPNQIPKLIADVMYVASQQPALANMFTDEYTNVSSVGYRDSYLVVDKNLVFEHTPMRPLTLAWGSSTVAPFNRYMNVIGKNRDKEATCKIYMFNKSRTGDTRFPVSYLNSPEGFFIGKWHNKDCDNFAGFIINYTDVCDETVEYLANGYTFDYKKAVYTQKELEEDSKALAPLNYSLSFNGHMTYDDSVEYLLNEESGECDIPFLLSTMFCKQTYCPQEEIKIAGFIYDTFKDNKPFYLEHSNNYIYVEEYNISSIHIRFSNKENYTDVSYETQVKITKSTSINASMMDRLRTMSLAFN